MQDFAHALIVLLSRIDQLSGEAVPNKDTLLKEKLVENLKDLILRRDIIHCARDHPTSTFQDICLEVHRYQEEDPSPRSFAVAREAAVEVEEVLCNVVGGQGRQLKVLADLISGQKVLAEEIQKQQKAFVTHVEQQREVLSRQQDLTGCWPPWHPDHEQLPATGVDRMVTSSVTVQSHHPPTLKGTDKKPQRCWETRRLHHCEPGGGGDRQWLTPSKDDQWNPDCHSKVGGCRS